MPVISCRTSKRLFHRPVSFRAAEDVALADTSFFGGENVADDDVAHVNPIQSGVEIRGHLAIEKIDDHLARRRRLHIARSDRRARIDDDDRHAFRGEFASHDFGAPLRELVVIAHLRFGDGRSFIGRRAETPFPACGKPMQPTVLV